MRHPHAIDMQSKANNTSINGFATIVRVMVLKRTDVKLVYWSRSYLIHVNSNTTVKSRLDCWWCAKSPHMVQFGYFLLYIVQETPGTEIWSNTDPLTAAT